MFRFQKEIKINCKVWGFLELYGTKVVLTKGQIDSIREIGFGGMLDIKITKYPPGILAYLISNFDPNGWVQRITNGRTEREYYITIANVNDIFGLPINPRKLIRMSFNNKDLVKWRKILGAGHDDELKTHMVWIGLRTILMGVKYLNNCLCCMLIRLSWLHCQSIRLDIIYFLLWRM